MSNKNADYYFFKGGGEMGELIRAKDWSKTALGDPADWPQSLRTMVAVMLDNPFGMYIAWGNDYTQLYNDGYRPILGATKHPQALGISTRETFSEIWHIIESMFDGVMKGTAVGFPDLMLPLNRNGFVEDCYFDFAYSPIRKDNGEVGGVLVTVIETTEKKRAAEALTESNARFINNIMQAPVAMCIFRGQNYVVEIANEQMLNLWGKQADQVMNKPIFEGLPEAKDQGLEPLLNRVFTTGEKFVANERPVNLPRNGKVETTYINFVYEALKEPDGTISGIVAIAIEVTPQVNARSKVEKSEQKIRALVANAPFPIAVYVGKEMIVELANQSIIDIWGKGNDVIGKSFKEVLPELDNQLVFEQIQKVLETGESFHTKNTPLDLIIDGKPYTYYFNYSFTPLYDISGNIYGVMNTGVDLTELNIAKKKIEESEEQLRIAIEGGEFGTFDFIPETNQLIWSAKTKELFGLPADAHADYETYLAALHPEDRNTSMAIAQQQADLKEGGLYELDYRTIGITDSKLRWLRSKGKATYNKEGEAIRYTGVIQDITKQKESAEKVRESNQRFRNTMKQAPVGITILRGPEYIVEMANDAYLQLVDKKEAEFVGKPLFTSLPEVKEAVHDLLDSVLNTGIPYHGNEVAIPVNRYGKQNVFYFDFLYHPLKEEDGKISGVIAIVTEVSEKVETRKTIEERKRLYESITQNIPDLIYVFDLNYRFTYANEALLNMWGRTWDDSIGKNMLEVGYEGWHAEMHEREIDQVVATKKPVRGEVSFPHATLGKRIYDYILVPVIDDDGKVEAIAGTTRDITQQVEARKQIKESEQRFQAAVQAVQGILWTNNGKGEMEGEQPGWATLTGQTYEEYQGYGWTQVVHPDDAQPTVDNWNDAVKERKTFIFEHRLKTKNGEWRDFSIRAIPLLNADGTLLQWVGVHTDITDNKQAAKTLKANEEKLNIVIEASELGTWEIDLTTNDFIYSNRYLEIMGYPHNKEITVNDTEKLIHPDYIEAKDEAIKKSRETGVFYFAGKIIWEDNSIHWIESKARLFYDEQNHPLKIIGTTDDITKERIHQQELEESEEQFKALADQAPMWVWLTDKEVNILYTNPEVLKFLGIAHYTEFTGNMWEQKVHPEDIGMVYQSFGEAASLQQSFSFEFRVLNASTQQYEWFYIRAVPRLEAGEFTGFIGTGININEQKLILSQLEYRKALLEAHNESSIDGILLVDTKGKILSYNHRFVEIWNMPQPIVDAKDDDAALTFALTQLLHPDQFIEKVKWLYEHPDEISIDELEFKDGKIIERHGYPVASADGSYYAWSWVFRDITEQRKSERIVKESEEKFRLLADSMPQHIWTSDPEGNLNYYNQSVFDYSGLTLEQINKDGWIQIVHPDDREENIKQWFHAISTGKSFLFEHRFRRYDGEYRWQLSRAIPQKDKNDNIQMWVGTSTDIQDQKTREEKKDEFISIASHEMKTPLTTAKAYLQMLELLLGENNEDASLYTKKANQSVNRLNELISELLDVSKIRLGKLNYTVTTFNFNDMIESTVENIQLTSLTHSIVKTGQVNDTVTGDKDRLQQVVINLLTNAIKYSPGAEKVFINLAQEKDSITVSVKDAGIGIAQHSLDKIFEKYHRVEEHAVHFQGLGIGLFISYEIIQRHHGRLWAESEPGKGSTFYFTIPINSNL